MRITDLQDPAPALATAAIAGLAGAIVGPVLVRIGLRQLDVSVGHPLRQPASCVAGGIAGVAAVLVARHAGSWWLLPAALVWTCALAAAAVCDSFTQRVPTGLVRQGAAATAILVVVASAGAGHWRWALLAAVSAAAAGVIFAFCWQFLGAGFGDVRIAVLGGLGLVNPTHVGVGAGIGLFIVLTLGQAATVLARGGNRRTLFPYAPAIAAAFVIVAVL